MTSPTLHGGVVLNRRREGQVEVLLIRPGDPLRAAQDEGMWSIPKGAPRDDEGLLSAAQRHFRDITGTLPSGTLSPLAAARMGSETVLYPWSAEGDWGHAVTQERDVRALLAPRVTHQAVLPAGRASRVVSARGGVPVDHSGAGGPVG